MLGVTASFRGLVFLKTVPVSKIAISFMPRPIFRIIVLIRPGIK